MRGWYKSAIGGVFIASFVMAGAARADVTPASQLSLQNMGNVQVPVGMRIGAKRKSESKAVIAGLPLLAVMAGAAAVTVGVVAVAAAQKSSSP